MRAKNNKDTVLDKLTYDQGYNDRLVTMRKENEKLHKGVLEYKTDIHDKHKAFEDQAKINKDKRNPFVAKVNK